MEGVHMFTHKQGDWLAKIDLKDAYFMTPVHHQDRKFLRFQNGREDISIQVPTIRPIQCTLDLYQDPTSSSDPPQRVGSLDGCLHRQHTGNGRIGSTIKGPCSMFNVSTQEPWVHHQLQKISVDTNKTVGVSTVYSGLGLSRAESSNRQSHKDQAGCPEMTKPVTHNSTRTT